MLMSRFVPAMNFAISSGLPTVADKPIRWNSLPVTSNKRSSAMVNCTPRLLSANSCTSSMMTCWTLLRCLRICEPGRIAWSVSGVVTSICGGWRACFLRVFISVSPCLTSTVMPSCWDHNVKRLSMSRFKARKGVM